MEKPKGPEMMLRWERKVLERLLKELGERGFEVSWRYEIMTNSIVIRMEKRIGGRWRILETRVEFSDLYSGGSAMFEFNMMYILREMAGKMERDFSESGSHSGYRTKVIIVDELEGENND